MTQSIGTASGGEQQGPGGRTDLVPAVDRGEPFQIPDEEIDDLFGPALVEEMTAETTA